VMTTAAFGAGISGRTATTNRGELAWEAVTAFGGHGRFCRSHRQFRHLDSRRLKLQRGFAGVDSSRLLRIGRTGCNWRGAIGAGMAEPEASPCSAGGGIGQFRGRNQVGPTDRLYPLVECGGLETIKLGPA